MLSREGWDQEVVLATDTTSSHTGRSRRGHAPLAHAADPEGLTPHLSDCEREALLTSPNTCPFGHTVDMWPGAVGEWPGALVVS